MRSKSAKQNKKTLNKVLNKVNNIQNNVKNIKKQYKKKGYKGKKTKRSKNADVINFGGNSHIPQNPIKLRKMNPQKAMTSILSTNKRNLIQYIYGLIHPDIAISECMQVKKPSGIPIPSTTFGIKRNLTLKTNSSGNLALIWVPNYLCSLQGFKDLHSTYPINSQLTGNITVANTAFTNLWYTNSDNLDGAKLTDIVWNAHPINTLSQDFARYRLTSALIKVKYTGNKLNQAGMMYSSASYKQLPYITAASGTMATTLSSNSVENADDYFMKFNNFDVTRNGQWNKSVNVTANANGLEALYVPTDPMNDVFAKDGFVTSTEKTTGTESSNLYVCCQYPNNTNIKYSFVCQGLPASTACVTVETYYNFEIIVEQEQMPYFHSVNSAHGVNLNDVNEAHQALVNSGNLVRPSRSSATSKLDKVLKWGSRAISVAKIVGSLL